MTPRRPGTRPRPPSRWTRPRSGRRTTSCWTAAVAALPPDLEWSGSTTRTEELEGTCAVTLERTAPGPVPPPGDDTLDLSALTAAVDRARLRRPGQGRRPWRGAALPGRTAPTGRSSSSAARTPRRWPSACPPPPTRARADTYPPITSGTGSSVGSTAPNDARTTEENSMDIVLIAGLWLDGSAWDDVCPGARGLGHRPMPGDAARAGRRRRPATYDDQVAAVVAAVDAADGSPLVVGHSAACDAGVGGGRPRAPRSVAASHGRGHSRRRRRRPTSTSSSPSTAWCRSRGGSPSRARTPTTCRPS